MPLTPGTTLGPYQVTAKIGEGGMGEVYRARDTKLDRDVALKVLPQAFTDDPDRLARFEREAKVLASLNHPNIGHIYGLEEAEGQKALVLELVEGPTLAERIKQGPIPVDEALPIAKQIAEALEAAHEQGIIHRDLKPANVKVKDDGTVKVLDFGLAKAFQPDASDVSASMSPTISLTAAATQMGMVIGTAAYMAPEQAKGRPVDKRADVWAFGVVLYEMFTGSRPFAGDDVSETLARVIDREPDWDTLPGNVPPGLSNFLRHCLQKNPKKRIRDIGDVSLALEGTFEPTVSTSAEPITAPQLQLWQRPVPAALALLVVAATASLAVWTMMRPDVTPAEVMRFAIVPSDTAPLGLGGGREDLVISRDGTVIVYKGLAPDGGRPQLYLRPIDQLAGAPLRGGEGGFAPFVSPDGEWVGFMRFPDQTTLQKVSIFGGPPVTLTESPNDIYGASWGTDDQIVFGGVAGLFRVPGGGGEPESLTTPDTEQSEIGHGWPFIIPDRNAVAFVIFGAGSIPLVTGQLAVLDLDTREVTRLGLAGVSPHYVSTGHLVYADADGSVRAVPFDAATLEVTGNPVPLVEGVVVKGLGGANFSISDDGLLVYVSGTGGVGVERSFVWVDRDGQEEPVEAAPRPYQEFTLSPDGSRVAVRVAGENSDVWVYDLMRNTNTRLTFGEGGGFPTWTPDGTRLAFGAPLSWKLADGTGEVQVLAETPQQFPMAFSPDGGVLVFEDRSDGVNIGMLALDGDRSSTLLLQGGFPERNASLSPDGRWIAYESEESGVSEVYVQPFPDIDSGRWQVSSGFGRWPVWSPTGQELFFVIAQHVMALAYDDDPTFDPGTVTQLFDVGPYQTAQSSRRIAVNPDGERFLLLKNETGQAGTESSAQPEITVVLNWFEELKERVPVP